LSNIGVPNLLQVRCNEPEQVRDSDVLSPGEVATLGIKIHVVDYYAVLRRCKYRPAVVVSMPKPTSPPTSGMATPPVSGRVCGAPPI